MLVAAQEALPTLGATYHTQVSPLAARVGALILDSLRGYRVGEREDQRVDLRAHRIQLCLYGGRIHRYAPPMSVLSTILGLAIMAGFYLLPTYIAHKRQHNTSGVAIVNVLIGWTGIGWVIALVMACGAN